MKFLKLALVAAAASVAMSGAAMAEELKLSYNVGVASDYVFRGVSQTQEDPQVFGGIDLTYGLGYAGVWASNVDFGPSDPTAEIDLYAGLKPTYGDTSFDLGVLYYSYIDDKAPPTPAGQAPVASPGSYSYLEFKAAVSRPIGPATAGLAVYYSPQYPLTKGGSMYYELNAAMPVVEKLTLSGAIGEQQIDQGSEYATWNIGLNYALTDKISADLRYSDTDEHDLGKIYGERVVVGLKAAF
ncbi:TorF family putative porin [Caulobacter sp.]|uniref:TorF family putative porin n=1 Tax=Caulobacter sp. TaxID=78 RepID=UPI003BAF2A34